MELLKTPTTEQLLKFTWNDVTFLVKPRAGAMDKFELDTRGDLAADGTVTMSRTIFYRVLVERFVVGWEGVTEDGRPVPYSFARIERLPALPDDDLIFKLGAYIATQTNVLAEPQAAAEAKEALKNG